jgi:Ecdysteroid kinase-like family
MSNRYKKENGAMVPKEISIVDFATGCWGSPAIDLAYLFVVSITPEFRKEKVRFFTQCLSLCMYLSACLSINQHFKLEWGEDVILRLSLPATFTQFQYSTAMVECRKDSHFFTWMSRPVIKQTLSYNTAVVIIIVKSSGFYHA